MTRYVRIGGAQRQVVARYVRVAGVWRQVHARWVKIAGTWRKVQITRDITVALNWGADGAGIPGPAVSLPRPLVIPAYNPGSVTISATNPGATIYRKNGGAPQAMGTGTFANGDQLSFELNAPSGGFTFVTVTDATTGAQIGTWSGSVV